MAKFDYDFDFDLRPPQRPGGRWERRVRVILLFCAVAAVTAAVIYAVIPSRTVKPAADLSSSAASSGNDRADAPRQDGRPDVSATAKNTGEAGTGSTEPPKIPDVPASSPGAEEGKSGSAAATAKGRSGPADPAPADDVPLRSGDRNTAAEQELRNLLNSGDYKKFFAEAEKAVAATATDSAARAGLGKILTEGRHRAWQNGKWRSLEPAHKVVHGDNLSALARRYHTTVNGIQRGNKLKSAAIMIGQKLRVIPGPWRVVVSKKARLLTLYRLNGSGRSIFAVCDIGIGRNDSTPTGEFVICHRRLHPVYRDPQGRVFAHGNARNPLGEAFLALARPDKPTKPYKGYGIHGTADDTSVGRSVSSGCVRMRNDDIMMLYYLLPAATPVEISD